MSVCALGNTVAEAQTKAYGQIERVRWEGMHYRRDIGYRAVARERLSK
jgi:phosphoribosylamine--glycine ligase